MKLLIAIGLLLLSNLAAWAQTDPRNDYHAFAREIERTINNGDPSFFNDNYDKDAYLKALIGDLKLTPEFQATVFEGVHSSLNLGHQITEGLGNMGSYKLLEVTEGRGGAQARFRLLNNQGLNYHVLYLGKNRDLRVVIREAYAYSLNQPITQYFHQSFVLAANNQNGAPLGGLTAEEDLHLKNRKKLDSISAFMKDGQYKAFLTGYTQLPMELKRDKQLLYLRLIASANLNGGLYQDALDEYKKWHGSSDGLNLIAIDGYFIAKQYDSALTLVDRLQKSVGDDAYLDVMRANLLNEKGLSDSAQVLAQAAIKKEPAMPQGYWMLAKLLAEKGDFATATAQLEAMRTQTKADPLKAAQTITAPGFAESADFLRWQQQLKVAK